MDQRIATALDELERALDFDYIVVNAQGKLEEAVKTIEAVIIAEHHRASQRQINI